MCPLPLCMSLRLNSLNTCPVRDDAKAVFKLWNLWPGSVTWQVLLKCCSDTVMARQSYM